MHDLEYLYNGSSGLFVMRVHDAKWIVSKCAVAQGAITSSGSFGADFIAVFILLVVEAGQERTRAVGPD